MVARVLVLLAALVVAAIGAGLVLLYASQARDNAARELELVPIYVADQSVPRGTLVSDAIELRLIVPEARPQDAMRGGILATPDQLTPDLRGQYLVNPLGPGQPLTPADIGQLTSATDDELGLTASGKNATSIPLDEALRGGPFLDPGETVDLFLTYTPLGETVPCTRLLVPNIKVLAVGGTPVAADPAQPADPAAPAAQPAAGPLLTLELTPDTPLAARIRHAATLGGISAVLLDGPTSSRTGDVAETCVSVEDLFIQDDPSSPPAAPAP